MMTFLPIQKLTQNIIKPDNRAICPLNDFYILTRCLSQRLALKLQTDVWCCPHGSALGLEAAIYRHESCPSSWDLKAQPIFVPTAKGMST